MLIPRGSHRIQNACEMLPNTSKSPESLDDQSGLDSSLIVFVLTRKDISGLNQLVDCNWL